VLQFVQLDLAAYGHQIALGCRLPRAGGMIAEGWQNHGRKDTQDCHNQYDFNECKCLFFHFLSGLKNAETIARMYDIDHSKDRLCRAIPLFSHNTVTKKAVLLGRTAKITQ
jgi:hypothetical protein